MRYELRGDYPARHFFRIDATSGEVFVTEHLDEDSLQTLAYHLRVAAFDSAYSTRESVTIFEIKGNGRSCFFRLYTVVS